MGEQIVAVSHLAGIGQLEESCCLGKLLFCQEGKGFVVAGAQGHILVHVVQVVVANEQRHLVGVGLLEGYHLVEILVGLLSRDVLVLVGVEVVAELDCAHVVHAECPVLVYV